MRSLLTTAHRQRSDEGSSHDPARSWSASLGPGAAQCQETDKPGSYGSSVYARATQQPDRVWDERIRLYTEGLASAPWKTAPTLQVRTRNVSGGGHASRIRCPSTVIFGLQDKFLDPRLVVERFENMINTESSYKGQEILLEDVGHWSPSNPACARILELVLLSCIQGKSIDLKQQKDVITSAVRIRRFGQ